MHGCSDGEAPIAPRRARAKTAGGPNLEAAQTVQWQFHNVVWPSHFQAIRCETWAIVVGS